MKPSWLCLLPGLLLVERSEALGSSLGSTNTVGSGQLGPESADDLETENLFESIFDGENHLNKHEEVWIEVRAKPQMHLPLQLQRLSMS